jgi:hypothetical protein
MSEFPIESDTFIGKAFIIIANLKDSPPSFFQSKFEAVFQGRFKRPIPYSRVYTGQAHKAALPHIPSEWLVNIALKFMTSLQPAIAVDLKGTKPYFLSPLVCTAQRIVISKPGEEPGISYGIGSIEENMSLLGPSFPKMSSHKRKAYFSKKENLKQYYFEPDLVYTFDFFQHRLNLATFMIDLGFIKYDLRDILMSRPIQIMAVEWEGPGKRGGGKKGTGDIDQDWKFLYNVEIWHKRCIKKTLRTGYEGNVKEGEGLLQSMSPQGEGESEHVRSPGEIKATSGLPSDPSRHPNSSISTSLYPIPRRVTFASDFPSTPVTPGRPRLAIFRRNSCGMVTLNPSPVITPHNPNPTPTPTPKQLEVPTKPELARNRSDSITQRHLVKEWTDSIDLLLKDGHSSQSKSSSQIKSAPGSLSKLSPISLVKKKLNLLSSKGKN